MGIQLPFASLCVASVLLVAFNLVSSIFLRHRSHISTGQVFTAMLVDITVLTWQLYLTGGITNPFSSLLLLQIVLGSVLLGARSPWLLSGITIVCFALLSVFYIPLDLGPDRQTDLFTLYLRGSFICFVLIALLLVTFVTRVTQNLRALDARLAKYRQHAAEEELILRMGLLASEAAHELGTPLSSLSVILNDWKYLPAVTNDPDLMEEVGEMLDEVQRCKSIVTGILLSAGEARGETLKVTSLTRFLDDLASEWRSLRSSDVLIYENNFGEDVSIVSDSVLKKVIFNILDNALQASPTWVGMRVERNKSYICILITDKGPGFQSDILARFGKPYQSSKGKPGGGLGLFLAVSVFRKLCGSVSAVNPPQGGAAVTLKLPISALALEETHHDG